MMVLSLSDVSVAYSMFPVKTGYKQDFTAVEENLQCVMCRKHDRNVVRSTLLTCPLRMKAATSSIQASVT